MSDGAAEGAKDMGCGCQELFGENLKGLRPACRDFAGILLRGGKHEHNAKRD